MKFPHVLFALLSVLLLTSTWAVSSAEACISGVDEAVFVPDQLTVAKDALPPGVEIVEIQDLYDDLPWLVFTSEKLIYLARQVTPDRQPITLRRLQTEVASQNLTPQFLRQHAWLIESATDAYWQNDTFEFDWLVPRERVIYPELYTSDGDTKPAPVAFELWLFNESGLWQVPAQINYARNAELPRTKFLGTTLAGMIAESTGVAVGRVVGVADYSIEHFGERIESAIAPDDYVQGVARVEVLSWLYGSGASQINVGVFKTRGNCSRHTLSAPVGAEFIMFFSDYDAITDTYHLLPGQGERFAWLGNRFVISRFVGSPETAPIDSPDIFEEAWFQSLAILSLPVVIGCIWKLVVTIRHRPENAVHEEVG